LEFAIEIDVTGYGAQQSSWFDASVHLYLALTARKAQKLFTFV